MDFGFGGKHYTERLIYIAKITRTPNTGDYYQVRSSRGIYHYVRESRPASFNGCDFDVFSNAQG